MKNNSYVIGIDYGTDSVRTIVADSSSGKEISSSVFQYRRWAELKYCDPAVQQYRQHPLDYLDGLEHTVKECLAKCDRSVTAMIKGISIDTTGSTPVAVNKEGIPLSLLPGFEENPDAMFVLWKDHTSIKETEQINAHASIQSTDYLQYVGGIYSSEWYWAKLLHILRADNKVRESTFTFVEHCDWLPFLLTGGNDATKIKRSRCAAGHKALWAESFGGYPPDDFFSSIDPLLKGFQLSLHADTYAADTAAGVISETWASKLGLNNNVVIGIGALDAHMGAVGGQIEPYHLSKVMGTSTCDILVVPHEEIGSKTVSGICGQVDGSVVPGMIGMEAGQSAFGDYYAWFGKLLLWPLKHLPATSADKDLYAEYSTQIIRELSKRAANLPVEEDGILSTDWINGRRTPYADQTLKATIAGLDLSSDPVKIFRSIAESTCFGAKAITECFVRQGISIRGVIALGGIANKSPFLMQMLADVLNLPIRIHKSEQTCALGAAMFAATAAGIFDTVEDAMKVMGQGFSATYCPDAKLTEVYQKKYERYLELGSIR